MSNQKRRNSKYLQKSTHENNSELTQNTINVYHGPVQQAYGNENDLKQNNIGEKEFPLKKIIVGILIGLFTVPTLPWWAPYLKNYVSMYSLSPNATNTINIDVYELIKELNNLPTDEEKQEFVKKYGGMWINQQYGFFRKSETANSDINVEITDSPAGADVALEGQKILECKFFPEWQQKVALFKNKDSIRFFGKIDRYDKRSGRLLLSSCKL